MWVCVLLVCFVSESVILLMTFEYMQYYRNGYIFIYTFKSVCVAAVLQLLLLRTVAVFHKSLHSLLLLSPCRSFAFIWMIHLTRNDVWKYVYTMHCGQVKPSILQHLEFRKIPQRYLLFAIIFEKQIFRRWKKRERRT